MKNKDEQVYNYSSFWLLQIVGIWKVWKSLIATGVYHFLSY